MLETAIYGSVFACAAAAIYILYRYCTMNDGDDRSEQEKDRDWKLRNIANANFKLNRVMQKNEFGQTVRSENAFGNEKLGWHEGG